MDSDAVGVQTVDNGSRFGGNFLLIVVFPEAEAPVRIRMELERPTTAELGDQLRNPQSCTA